ncbi:MAG: alpha/beta fold hydrolase, partial [Methanomicrobiales archaeon]|nr:alpha/beta fold hydrolase [Methanomicrobiales archaeon]
THMPETIVYLHGFGSGPGSKKALFFVEQARRLGVEIAVPDLTEGDFERLTITRQLGVVERLVAGRRVSLIGSSLGGYLAALYAARHKEVHKAVLLAPAFGFARHWPERLGPDRIDEWRRNGWMGVYHYGRQQTLPLGFQLLEDGLRYEDFPEVHQPILLIHGTRDEIVTPDWSRQYASARPNVELELVDSDHELISVLDWTWNRIRRFLDFEAGHSLKAVLPLVKSPL